MVGRSGAGSITVALRTSVQKSSGELRAMGRRGKELVQEKYTWRRIAETSQLYQYMSSGGARPEFVSVAEDPRREPLDKKAA